MDWAVVFLSDLTDEIKKKKIEKLLLLAFQFESIRIFGILGPTLVMSSFASLQTVTCSP